MGLWAGCQEKLLCGVPVVAKWGQGRWFLSLGDCLVWSLLLMEAAHGVGSAQLTLQREQRWKRERNTVGEGKGGVWGKLCPSAIQCLLGDLRFHVICFSFMSCELLLHPPIILCWFSLSFQWVVSLLALLWDWHQPGFVTFPPRLGFLGRQDRKWSSLIPFCPLKSCPRVSGGKLHFVQVQLLN